MKFSYKFAKILGAIYSKGNVLFTPDGCRVVSPIGNHLNVFDLRNNKTRTLPIEARYNYTNIAISPDGKLLIVIDENGEAQLVSFTSFAVIQRHKFQSKINSIKFSPNSMYFAVAKDNIVFVFYTPREMKTDYSGFILKCHFLGGYDDVTCMCWSFDSRFLCIGNRDKSTKIYAISRILNFRTFVVGGHTDSIVSCFFESKSIDLITLSRNAQLCLWESSLEESDMTKSEEYKHKKKHKIALNNEELEDDVKVTKEPILDGIDNEQLTMWSHKESKNRFFYKKKGRYYLSDDLSKEIQNVIVTAADYNSSKKILVVAFNTGSCYLYELPEMNIIHSLNVTEFSLSATLFNATADWILLASQELGQILVWEWQSEQYIMKQQSHTNEITSICYSPDGQYIATGGVDGKLKVWNSQNGFCFVTFSEHLSAITGIQFSRNKKFLASSSLDSTVRAFDITRYRNFRTMTAPRKVQFSCVAVDFSGEFIAAGGSNLFEIYLWATKTGQLLEMISGHEGPVSCIAFSSIASSLTLVSGSWDKHIKIWNCLETKQLETIDMLSDVLSVTYSPSGANIAVATLSGYITVIDVQTGTQLYSIDGKKDLFDGSTKGKYFTTIEYSADGNFLLAAGTSSVICIYHVQESMLLKKFHVIRNHSLNGFDDYINYRKISDFGNLSANAQREDESDVLKRPGKNVTDMVSRTLNNEVKVFSVKFSPLADSFAVACTEGIHIFSLDDDVLYDPRKFNIEETFKSVKDTFEEGKYCDTLIIAIKLNNPIVLELVLENIPFENIRLICAALSIVWARHLLYFLAKTLNTTAHIEFYMEWCCCLLITHGNAVNALEQELIVSLNESMNSVYEKMNRICDFNKYTMLAILDAYTGLSSKD